MEQSGSAVQGRVDPSDIMALSTAFWGSQTLLTANRLGLFDVLAAGGRTAASVADKLQLDGRATVLFLNACVALGLCEKGADHYSNSKASAAFLASGSPMSMSNAIKYSDDLYSTWGSLEQAVRTGIAPKSAESYLGDDEQLTRNFVYGMHDRAMAIGRPLPDLIDLGGRKKMLDVGGGPGTFSSLLVDRYDGLVSDVLELEGVAVIAQEILEKLGTADRVTMRKGDYLSSDFGSGYDVVLMSGMFHRESKENCRRLIAKASACLEPGGLLVVNDVFTDESGDGPAFATLFGLTMLLTAPDGGVHADADVASWMADAGFVDTHRQPFPAPMPHRVVTGVKS